ncbi:MAG: hypothetical protein ABFR31_01780 [Thermodesulfobacteriota bacterium]
MAEKQIQLLSVKESITLTPSEWNVIVMLYNYPDLDELKSKYSVNTDQLNAILEKLQAKKAIQSTHIKTLSSAEVPSSFWDRLEKELSISIGPVASLVLDDKIEEFNRSRDNFSHEMLYSLVEKLVTEINSPDGKQQFQKKMLTLIKQYQGNKNGR